MSVRGRSTRLLLGFFLALLAFGVLCTSAFAATPRIVASVSKPYPKSNSPETVYAKALNSKGKPITGMRITFTWRIGTRVITVRSWTNRRGIAESTRNIGSSSIWRNHAVSITGRIGGRTRRTTAVYVPTPVVSAGHPARVNIGIAGPLSKGLAIVDGQGSLRAATLAIEQANASTETVRLGLHFEGVTADDQGDPRTAVTVAEALRHDARVLGVVGHLNSGCSIPASKVYWDGNVAMISPWSTNPALTEQGLRNVFRATYGDDHQGPAAADAAWTLGKREAIAVDDGTPYGMALSFTFAGRFMDHNSSVHYVHTDYRQTDFSAAVAQIRSANPDIVYYGGVYNAGALLTKQLHDAGVEVPVMGGEGLFDPAFITLAGSAAAEGDFCTAPGYPSSALPNGTDFVSAFQSRYPGVEMTDCDAYSYDAANVIISAIMAEARVRGAAVVGSPADKTRIIRLIAATDKVGVTGKIRFDSKGDRLEPTMALYRVVSGSWTYQGLAE